MPTITASSTFKIACGQTSPDDWQQYHTGFGVYVQVKTHCGKFPKTPLYFSSIGGSTNHWATTGASSIYHATSTGFTVYIRWDDGGLLSPADAKQYGWHINWYALLEE